MLDPLFFGQGIPDFSPSGRSDVDVFFMLFFSSPSIREGEDPPLKTHHPPTPLRGNFPPIKNEREASPAPDLPAFRASRSIFFIRTPAEGLQSFFSLFIVTWHFSY